ncbi:MAG: TonB-dependent receptor plug domain-containing protein [Thermoanaerobaculaceae bacterium]|jgi:outer membrane cobalamin receptor|nr:TonB-dependent receptor plug domain-containing protein [Thermoanaerobaculaceae bacterium]
MHPVGLGAWLLAGALARQVHVHEVVTVTASRLPAEAAAPRRTVVLEREEIARLPVGSVHELVAHVVGAGLARRGPMGVQGDLQLRGSTFEQAVVLVDGVRLNDPQTGHFNLDLPLDLDAVERIRGGRPERRPGWRCRPASRATWRGGGASRVPAARTRCWTCA